MKEGGVYIHFSPHTTMDQYNTLFIETIFFTKPFSNFNLFKRGWRGGGQGVIGNYESPEEEGQQ